ncbi:MAG TPA: nucleotidyltransferase family protein [Bacillota bacterium]|nr:nucleotidyltransferase family protein [Bacillota bacterium]
MPPIAILAGGLATRLLPETGTVPKALLEVAGRPFIHHQLKLLKRKGFTQAVICAGHLGEQIRESVQKVNGMGLKIIYSFDGESLLGTGGALLKAAPLLGDVFMVTYGDTYLDTDYGAVLQAFREQNQPGLITVLKNENRWGKSNVLFAGGRIIKYDKRDPTADMKHIDYGLAVLKSRALAGIPAGEFYDLSDLYARLADRGSLAGYEVKQRFYEIGSREGLRETRQYFEKLEGVL